MVDHSPNQKSYQREGIGLEIRKFSLIFALEYEDPHTPSVILLLAGRACFAALSNLVRLASSLCSPNISTPYQPCSQLLP